jgi:hypothetical protein
MATLLGKEISLISSRYEGPGGWTSAIQQGYKAAPPGSKIVIQVTKGTELEEEHWAVIISLPILPNALKEILSTVVPRIIYEINIIESNVKNIVETTRKHLVADLMVTNPENVMLKMPNGKYLINGYEFEESEIQPDSDQWSLEDFWAGPFEPPSERTGPAPDPFRQRPTGSSASASSAAAGDAGDSATTSWNPRDWLPSMPSMPSMPSVLSNPFAAQVANPTPPPQQDPEYPSEETAADAARLRALRAKSAAEAKAAAAAVARLQVVDIAASRSAGGGWGKRRKRRKSKKRSRKSRKSKKKKSKKRNTRRRRS